MAIRLNKVLSELNIGLQTAIDFLRINKIGDIEEDAKPSIKITDEQYEALFVEFKGEQPVNKKSVVEFENLEKKLSIIEKIRSMLTTPEMAYKSYRIFKNLQQEWREIKNVPAENDKELWVKYQLSVEQYYDLLKKYSEANKKDNNLKLEIKTKLSLEGKQQVDDEVDVISSADKAMKHNKNQRIKDVFISYSRKDIHVANQICKAFDSASISYFIDRQGISGGKDFYRVIANAICECKLFLFLASSNSYNSKYTNREIAFAFDEMAQESIIPYIIDNSQLPRHLRFIFSGINCRVKSEHPIESVLISDIKDLLGKN